MPGHSLSFKCPDCGAAVPFDGTSPVTAIRCSHCGNTVVVPESLRPRAGRIVVDPELIPKGPCARPSLVGCVVPLLVAGGIVGFTAWRMSTASFGSIPPLNDVLKAPAMTRTRLVQPGRIVASGAGADQLFAIVRNYGGSQYQDAMARFDLASGARAWEQPATYLSAFAVDAARVFITNKSRLAAFDRASGTALWEASLSDEVQNACAECLVAFAGRVVAHTKDGALQAFDATTGRVVLSRELGRPNRVSVVGDRLLVIAPEKSGRAVQATVIDADGRDVRSFPVRCAGQWGNGGALGWSDFSYADAPSRTLVAWYEGGCVQRYDLERGALAASFTTDRGASFGSNAAVLPAGGVIYLGEDENLHALALAGGQPRRLVNAPDYALRPFGASGSVVAVRARRRVGSMRFEIWGVDTKSGTRLWQRKMGDDARPMEPPDEFIGILASDRDDVAFAAQVDGDRLRVVRAGGRGGPWVAVETLDLATGTSGGEKRTSVEASDHISAPRVIGWRGRVAWLFLDGHAVAIDTEAGKVLSRLP